MDWLQFSWAFLAGLLSTLVVGQIRRKNKRAPLWNCFNPLGLEYTLARVDPDFIVLCQRYQELQGAVEALRAAQRAYILNRGSDDLGRAVAEAASRVDAVMAQHNA
jgi:hypothetical protein